MRFYGILKILQNSGDLDYLLRFYAYQAQSQIIRTEPNSTRATRRTRRIPLLASKLLRPFLGMIFLKVRSCSSPQQQSCLDSAGLVVLQSVRGMERNAQPNDMREWRKDDSQTDRAVGNGVFRTKE